MKLTLNIELELDNGEISFLRKEFEGRPHRSFNRYFHQPPPHFFSLLKKDILVTDSMGNSSLTTIGRMVVNRIDRDNRIDEILS